MARQKGIIKLEGSVGDLSFYKSRHGYIAREKSGVTGQRIANDPAFQRTRENGQEFGRAGKAGKVLRGALRPILQGVKDPGMASRLMRTMMRVVKADQVSTRGQRNVLDGELLLLQGFEFNLGAALGTAVFVPFSSTIDRVAGTLEVAVPAFVPGSDLASPQGATHFRFIAAGAEVDFELETYTVDVSRGSDILLGQQSEAGLTLTCTVPANSTGPLFLAFGVEFFQMVNGQQYPLKNGSYNALQLVKVDA